MIREIVDNIVGTIAPTWQLKREAARVRLKSLRASTGHSSMDKIYGGGQGGYDAAKKDRLTRIQQSPGLTENMISRPVVQQLRNDSWDLYRNNPHARKICRQLESKVVGRGLMPQPLATSPDGGPWREWRARARQLWRDVGAQIDYRGRPGKGGQHLVDLQKTALRGTILGGEIFARVRRLNDNQQRKRNLLLPVQLQLIHADRLDETKVDHRKFYGIEFNDRDERVAYYFHMHHPSDHRATEATASKRVWASEISHLFVGDDIDQIRGTPWFSAALLKMRDVSEYEYNELQAAAMAACVVLGYRRSRGQTDFGLAAPSEWDLSDTDGNTITNIAPGMLLDLGQDGDIVSFDPQRPNTSMPEFISHMVRGEAASVPGVKASSLTGDYRGASFSAERSADNDSWPELEGLQDWMAWSFCQPLYNSLVETAVMAGYFDAVTGFTSKDFLLRKSEFLLTEWNGPVGRSINPKDDAEAGKRRMASFTSSPQREAAVLGRSTEDILEEWEDFISLAQGRGIPDAAIFGLLGVEQQTEEQEEVSESEEEKDKKAEDNKPDDLFQRGGLNGHKSKKGRTSTAS